MEYIGYQPTDIIDWAGLTTKVADKITAISKDRETRRQELDDLKTASEKEISKGLDLRNQSLQNVVIDGASQGRDLLNTWNKQLKNGEIDPKTYKQKISNLNDYWQSLAGSAQTYDNRYEEILKRQNPDENGVIAGSNLELEFASRFGAATELKNKKIRVDQDGRVFLAEIDPNTGEIIRDITDVKSLNRPENMIVNRVNMNSEVNDLMKGFKASDNFKSLVRGGSITVTSVKENDGYKETRARIANTVAPDTDPRRQVSVLVDNGVIDGPEYYETEAERKQKLEEMVANEQAIKRSIGKELTEADIDAMELKLIRLKNVDGIITPVLTNDQKSLAKKAVEQTVDMNVETIIDYNAPESYNYNNSGGGGGDDKTDEPQGYSLYKALVDAWGKPEGASKLTAMSGGKFIFKAKQGGGYEVRDTDGKLVTTIGRNDARSAAPLLGFGTGTGSAGTTNSLDEFDRQKKAYWSVNSGKVNNTTDKKEIKASDIPSKAKAAGYSESEYKTLLKQRGVKIV